MRNHKKLICIIAGIFFLGGIYLSVFQPFKITDPSQEGFDVEKFRFEDYRNSEAKRYAFKLLFPQNTDKSYIDRILIDKGGARAVQNENDSDMTHYLYTPIYPSIDGWNITVEFNDKKKMQKLLVNGFDVTEEH